MSVKIISVSDFRRNVSRIIKVLQQQGETVYVTQRGHPQAVLLNYEQYELLLKQTSIQPVARIDPDIIRNDPEMIALVK